MNQPMRCQCRYNEMHFHMNIGDCILIVFLPTIPVAPGNCGPVSRLFGNIRQKQFNIIQHDFIQTGSGAHAASWG